MDHAPKYKWAPFPAYKISKAALNMLTVQWAQEYAEEGFTVFALTPGVSYPSCPPPCTWVNLLTKVPTATVAQN